jgi:hypothetical protein
MEIACLEKLCFAYFSLQHIRRIVLYESKYQVDNFCPQSTNSNHFIFAVGKSFSIIYTQSWSQGCLLL